MSRKNMKQSEKLSEFLNWIASIEAEFSKHYEEVGTADKTTQDLLHQIELGSYTDRNKYCTQLSRLRKERRIHKDLVDTLNELNTYIKTPEFIKVKRRLQEILGSMRKKENLIDNNSRVYTPRVVSDLKFVQTRKERKNK